MKAEPCSRPIGYLDEDCQRRRHMDTDQFEGYCQRNRRQSAGRRRRPDGRLEDRTRRSDASGRRGHAKCCRPGKGCVSERCPDRVGFCRATLMTRSGGVRRAAPRKPLDRQRVARRTMPAAHSTASGRYINQGAGCGAWGSQQRVRLCAGCLQQSRPLRSKQGTERGRSAKSKKTRCWRCWSQALIGYGLATADPRSPLTQLWHQEHIVHPISMTCRACMP